MNYYLSYWGQSFSKVPRNFAILQYSFSAHKNFNQCLKKINMYLLACSWHVFTYFESMNPQFFYKIFLVFFYNKLPLCSSFFMKKNSWFVDLEFVQICYEQIIFSEILIQDFIFWPRCVPLSSFFCLVSKSLCLRNRSKFSEQKWEQSAPPWPGK